MRRLGIAATLAAVVVALTAGPSWAVDPPTKVPPTIPPTTVSEPPVGSDAIPPGASPTDPQAFLCELTGSLLDTIDEKSGGQASAVTGPLREQHAGFCSGGGGGDESPVPGPVRDALCPVLDQVISGASADPTGQVAGLAQMLKGAIPCPAAPPPTTTTTAPKGASGGGGSGGGGASDPAVLGGGAGASNGELPRTGAALSSLLGLGGLGLAGLRGIGRRFLRP